MEMQKMISFELRVHYFMDSELTTHEENPDMDGTDPAARWNCDVKLGSMM